MERYHQIVVGFDGSPCAGRAVVEAMKIAGWSVAPLWSIRAIPKVDLKNLASATSLSDEALLKTRERQDIAGLEVLSEPHPETEWHHSCRVGKVISTLLETAEEKSADLLIVGTHGHTHAEIGALGSVARECLQDASCDVLLIREALVGDICKIVAVVGDGTSDHDREAYRKAAAVASRGGCSLEVLTCFSETWREILAGDVDCDLAEVSREGVAERTASLEKMISTEHVPPGTPSPRLSVIANHSPSLGTLEALRKRNPDLIVLESQLISELPTVERIVEETTSSILMTKNPPKPQDPTVLDAVASAEV